MRFVFVCKTLLVISLHPFVTDSLEVIVKPGLSADVSEHATRIVRKKLKEQD